MKPFLFPKNTCITVLGNVGSGKTTLAKALAKNSNAQYMDIDLYIKNDFLASYVHEPSRWAFQTGLAFSYERSKAIDRVKRVLKSRPVILDQGFNMGIEVYSKTSYLNGEMTDSEWQLLNTLHGQLMTSAPKSQVTIILEIPVKILMKRIKERARDHEQSYSETYVKALNERLIEYRQSLIKLTHTDSLMQFNYQKDQISTLGHQHKMLETFVLEVIRGGADAD